MNLPAYLKPLSDVERRGFAQACGTTWNHMRNIAYSGKLCGVLLAVAIEKCTGAAVRRWHLRPDDWHLIWPELIGTEGAPAVPATTEEVRDAA